MTEGASSSEWMISVDDHLIEPPNVWVDRLPAKYRDVGPRWFADDEGEAWHYEDRRQPIGGAVTNGAIWPPEDRPPVFYPLTWAEIPPACYDSAARLEAMTTDGVLAALFFPNLPGFAGGLFARAKNKDLALLCVQAYNDWLLDEFCAIDPGRFIGLSILPIWDGPLAVAEAERTIAKGARAVAYTMAPHNLGLPSIHDPDRHWDPLFSLLDETGVPLCTHLGTGINADVGLIGVPGGVSSSAPNTPGTVGAVMMQLAGQETLLDWLFSGNFQRFPNLKLCLSENGIGWIPAVLQTADLLIQMSRERVTHATDPENDPKLTAEAREMARASLDERSLRAQGSPLPSELFRDHVYGCFINDPIGLKNIDEIGIDNVMIETDFPHNSTWYPRSMEKAQESLADFDAEDRRKVLRGNAERVFNFTPAEPPVAVSA
ncbi:MAG: amidohydrolase family protein [Acidimicrobiia bacterium]